MPKVTEAHLAARRRQIVDAALVCFGRQGFHQTTVHDICRAADLSPGALYRYFPGKEDIIAAACAEGYDGDRSLFMAQEGRPARDALDEIIRIGMGELSDDNLLPLLRLRVELWAEALRNERVRALLDEVIGRYRGWVADILRAAQERGEVDPDVNPDALARVVIGTYQWLVVERAVDPQTDIEDYVNAVRALVGGRLWRSQDPKLEEETHA